MSENSAISWTDHTFNPWIGCTKVSPGCDNCYAERREDLRLHRVKWGAGQPRSRTKTWGDPRKWDKQHAVFFAEHGRRQRVFCASLADMFDNEVDPAWRTDLFALIRATPNLDWLLLTKRIGNAKAMLPADWGDGYPNVTLMATVVNQPEADRDVAKLLAVPARRRGLSIEPMLGPVDLRYITWHTTGNEGDGNRWSLNLNALSGFRATSQNGGIDGPRLDWVIAGGESGPNARPAHPDWFRALRDQCTGAGVPFHFKQWGEFVSVSEVEGPGRHYTFPDGRTVRRVGKKLAGRQLDGVEHNGFPA